MEKSSKCTHEGPFPGAYPAKMTTEVLDPKLKDTPACCGRATLHRWMSTGLVRAPKAIVRNGHAVWLWSEADIKRLRKTKEQIYRKGRGRKAASKSGKALGGRGA